MSVFNSILDGLESIGDGAKAAPESLGGWFTTHRRLSLTVIILVFIVVVLFGPAANCYKAWRASSELNAQYDAVATDNDNVTNDINRLQTEGGIKDEARRRGYAERGENVASVTGVDDKEQAGSNNMDHVQPEPVDEPWYIKTLDKLFGYSGISYNQHSN